MVYSREESLKHRVDRIKFFNTIFFVSTFVGVSLADIPNTAYSNLGGADIAAVISGMRTTGGSYLVSKRRHAPIERVGEGGLM